MEFNIFFFLFTYLLVGDEQMNSWKNLGKSFLLFLGTTFFVTLLLNTFYYFNVLSDGMLSVLSFLLPLLLLFFCSLLLGRGARQKGYLEGLKLGGCVIFFYLLLYILGFGGDFSFKLLLYYFIFLLASILGSMIGINQKD